MAGGLHFTTEQIRSLPLAMQIKIGLGIAAQLSQASQVAVLDKPKGGEVNAKV